MLNPDRLTNCYSRAFLVAASTHSPPELREMAVPWRAGTLAVTCRVFALLLVNLGTLIEAAAAGRRMLRERIAAFRAALWREGVNPNPGRPDARERRLTTIEKRGHPCTPAFPLIPR